MTTQSNAPGFSVAISVSGSEESRQMGFGDHELNRFTLRIAECFLLKNGRVVFGHDWREDGVMRAVAQLAEQAGSGGHPSDAGTADRRMVNLVPTAGKPVSAAAGRASDDAGGILLVQSLQEHLCESGQTAFSVSDISDRFSELWVLREILTGMLDPGFRICMGGRVSGYGGYYAGLAEEAFFSLKHMKPLYLVGGLGGVTREVIRTLQGHAPETQALHPPGGRSGANPELASRLGLPLEGLAEFFQGAGIDTLCKTNGLSKDENARLFETTDITSALPLIWKGFQSL